MCTDIYIWVNIQTCVWIYICIYRYNGISIYIRIYVCIYGTPQKNTMFLFFTGIYSVFISFWQIFLKDLLFFYSLLF